MPKVKQLDWSKLKPALPEHRQMHGTKQFATYEYREKRKGSKNGAIKTTKIPRALREEYGRDMQHIRSIMNED